MKYIVHVFFLLSEVPLVDTKHSLFLSLTVNKDKTNIVVIDRARSLPPIKVLSEYETTK